MRRAWVVAVVSLLAGAILSGLPADVAQAACGFTRIPSPNKGKTDNFLEAVDASSRDLAWIAGTVDDPVSSYGLTQTWRWDGGRWRLVPTPSPSKAYAVNVFDIASVGNGEAWLTGSWFPASFAKLHPLLMHYFGGAWHILRLPKSLNGGGIEGVDARGPDDVWIAGNAPGGMFVRQWDGTRWHQMSVPDVGTTATYIADITLVPGSRSVWVTGTYQGPPTEAAMVQRWNGHSWKSFTTPQPGPQVHMYAIDAASKSDVMAVGYLTGLPHTWGGQAIHFDGNSWTDLPAVDPSASFPGTFLYGVAMIGTRTYAVGTTTDGTSNEALMVEVWDGASWSSATTPALMTSSNAQSVAHIPGTKQAWVAGSEYDGSFRTVVLRGC